MQPLKSWVFQFYTINKTVGILSFCIIVSIQHMSPTLTSTLVHLAHFNIPVFEDMKQHFLYINEACPQQNGSPGESFSVSDQFFSEIMSSMSSQGHITTPYDTLCPVLRSAEFTVPQTAAYRRNVDHFSQNSLRSSLAHRLTFVAFSLQHPSFSHSPHSRATRHWF